MEDFLWQSCCAFSLIQQIFIYMADTELSLEFTVIRGIDTVPALEELTAW